jgi:DNA-binding response OmpR family regulator
MSNITKVLLIEDDPDQVLLYRSKLELDGFEVVAVRNGAEGLRLAREQKPDIVLLDLVLVGESGVDVLMQLKKDRATKEIPVVVLTNLIQEEIIGRTKKLGAVDFLAKTDTMPSDVVRRIREILKA